MSNFLTNAYSKFLSVFWIPTSVTPVTPEQKDLETIPTYNRAFGGSDIFDHNLNNFRSPIDVPRIKQDNNNWRNAISEAERQILPYRYIMQQMFMDIVLDAYLAACWEQRLKLTHLRHFKVVGKDGNEYENWTRYFEKDWFNIFTRHALNAKLYGYSLISMGELIDDVFTGVVTVRRTNINPDQSIVTNTPRTTQGIDWRAEPYCDWMIWISTPNDHAQSTCGYGLLYTIAPYIIYAKSNMIYNVDYNQKFGSPFAFMTSPEKNETEKQKKVNALNNRGSAGWMLADPDDKLEFLGGAQGKGYAAFEDLERRIQKMTAELILGHSDAIISAGKTPQSASSTGMGSSPQEKAMDDTMTSDGAFLKPIIEKDVFRIIRAHGVRSEGMLLPDDAIFEWDNDKEKAEEENSINDQNIKIASYIQSLANAGFIVDPKWIEEKMGLKLSDDENLLAKKGEFWVADQMAKAEEPVASPMNYLNYGKKPTHVTEEEWKAYTTDMDYKKATKDFDGDRKRMTKEEYDEYTEEIQEHLENGEPLDREDGETCDVHINCRCEIINGEWVADPDCCDNCSDLMSDYNAATNGDVKNYIFSKHIKA